MANAFLILGALGTFGWVAVHGLPPLTEPTVRPAVSTTNSSKTAYAAAGAMLEARQAPVPLVRRTRPLLEPLPPPASAVVDPQQQAQDDLDRKAARAAVEADGYKRVTLLGRASNGAWRAKGFRGQTEVLLTVDGTGRVTMD